MNAKQNIKQGSVVKYSKPQSDAEKAFRFVLLDEPTAEESRVDIQLICDWFIKPIERVDVEEIECAS